MPRDYLYHVAETFTSIQGEGVWTGTYMHFIRLAGCNVGCYAKPEDTYSTCRSALGQPFQCDTNYRQQFTATAAEMLSRVPTIDHICVTGGEPFLHNLQPLIEAAGAREIHIETSGTKVIPNYVDDMEAWVTCSPKQGFLRENVRRVSEWKFIVGKPDDIAQLYAFLDTNRVPLEAPVFLQPINGVDTIDDAALQLVLACIERNPQFRLSVQMHKYLRMR